MLRSARLGHKEISNTSDFTALAAMGSWWRGQPGQELTREDKLNRAKLWLREMQQAGAKFAVFQAITGNPYYPRAAGSPELMAQHGRTTDPGQLHQLFAERGIFDPRDYPELDRYAREIGIPIVYSVFNKAGLTFLRDLATKGEGFIVVEGQRIEVKGFIQPAGFANETIEASGNPHLVKLTSAACREVEKSLNHKGTIWGVAHLVDTGMRTPCGVETAAPETQYPLDIEDSVERAMNAADQGKHYNRILFHGPSAGPTNPNELGLSVEVPYLLNTYGTTSDFTT